MVSNLSQIYTHLVKRVLDNGNLRWLVSLVKTHTITFWFFHKLLSKAKACFVFILLSLVNKADHQKQKTVSHPVRTTPLMTLLVTKEILPIFLSRKLIPPLLRLI